MSIAAQGTVLQIETATAGTYVTVGEVTAINGPSESVTVLDPTNMSDTRRRKAPGLYDPGEISVDLHLNYGDTGQDRLRTQFAAKVTALWKIVVPAGALGSGASSVQTTLSFGGFVSRIQIGGRIDSIATMSLTITLDSAITES